MNAVKAQTIVLYTVGAIIGIFFFLILEPFLLPLFWAAVFAIILNPINQWLKKKTKSRNISVALSLIVGTVIVAIPLTILFGTTIGYLDAIYKGVGDAIVSFDSGINRLKTGLLDLPFLPHDGSSLATSLSERVYESIVEILQYLGQALSGIGTNILFFTVKLFVMLYALYFFLRDGENIITRARALVPHDGKGDRILFQRFEKAAIAVLKTTVIMGSLQGFIGGVIFYFAGIGGALLWGFLMGVATLVPSLGSAIIWLPAGIVMLVIGDIWAGIVVFVGGLAIITPLDYFLRPALIGKDVGVHPLLIFLSSLGGIMIIGFSGLILGPIIAALATSALDMLIDE